MSDIKQAQNLCIAASVKQSLTKSMFSESQSYLGNCFENSQGCSSTVSDCDQHFLPVNVQ